MPHPIRGVWRTRPGWSEFGAPRPNGAWKTHQGFDYYCPEGTPIYATGAGTVLRKRFDPTGYGHYVDIQRDDGAVTRDAHMQAASPLAEGARVTAQTVVGVVGTTGNASAIIWYVNGQGLRHDHHEVRVNGRVVDPIVFHGSDLAGGGGTPIGEEDMLADEREALFQIRDVLGARGGLNTETNQTVAFLVRDLSAALTAHIPAETARSTEVVAAVQKLLRYVIDGGEDVVGQIGSPDSIFGLALRILAAQGSGGGDAGIAPSDVDAIRADIAAIPEATLAAFGLQRA